MPLLSDDAHLLGSVRARLGPVGNPCAKDLYTALTLEHKKTESASELMTTESIVDATAMSPFSPSDLKLTVSTDF